MPKLNDEQKKLIKQYLTECINNQKDWTSVNGMLLDLGMDRGNQSFRSVSNYLRDNTEIGRLFLLVSNKLAMSPCTPGLTTNGHSTQNSLLSSINPAITTPQQQVTPGQLAYHGISPTGATSLDLLAQTSVAAGNVSTLPNIDPAQKVLQYLNDCIKGKSTWVSLQQTASQLGLKPKQIRLVFATHPEIHSTIVKYEIEASLRKVKPVGFIYLSRSGIARNIEKKYGICVPLNDIESIVEEHFPYLHLTRSKHFDTYWKFQHTADPRYPAIRKNSTTDGNNSSVPTITSPTPEHEERRGHQDVKVANSKPTTGAEESLSLETVSNTPSLPVTEASEHTSPKSTPNQPHSQAAASLQPTSGDQTPMPLPPSKKPKLGNKQESVINIAPLPGMEASEHTSPKSPSPPRNATETAVKSPPLSKRPKLGNKEDTNLGDRNDTPDETWIDGELFFASTAPWPITKPANTSNGLSLGQNTGKTPAKANGKR